MAKDKINGALFKNKNKEKKTHPDYTGMLNIDAEFARELYNRCRDAKNGEMRVNISAWLKEPKEAGKERFMSLNVDFPRETKGGARGADRDDDRGSRSKSRDFDDDIPFD